MRARRHEDFSINREGGHSTKAIPKEETTKYSCTPCPVCLLVPHLFIALRKKLLKKAAEKFAQAKNSAYLCIALSEKGRLAQLVQSVCLTSRGSGVRIPQRPLNKPFFRLDSEPIREDKAIPPPHSRALSSAGSERLPYKQRVGGSNPSAPTETNRIRHIIKRLIRFRFSRQSVVAADRGAESNVKSKIH